MTLHDRINIFIAQIVAEFWRYDSDSVTLQLDENTTITATTNRGDVRANILLEFDAGKDGYILNEYSLVSFQDNIALVSSVQSAMRLFWSDLRQAGLFDIRYFMIEKMREEATNEQL